MNVQIIGGARFEDDRPCTFLIHFRDGKHTVTCYRDHAYSGSVCLNREDTIDCVKRLQAEHWVPEVRNTKTQFDVTEWFLRTQMGD